MAMELTRLHGAPSPLPSRPEPPPAGTLGPRTTGPTSLPVLCTQASWKRPLRAASYSRQPPKRDDVPKTPGWSVSVKAPPGTGHSAENVDGALMFPSCAPSKLAQSSSGRVPWAVSEPLPPGAIFQSPQAGAQPRFPTVPSRSGSPGAAEGAPLGPRTTSRSELCRLQGHLKTTQFCQ